VSPRTDLLTSQEFPLLCYVTDRRTLPVAAPSEILPSLSHKIQQIALAGVDFVQIREKDLSAREVALATREALRITASGVRDQGGPRILVNDRLDVALAEGASGVHLAENSVSVQEAKRLVLQHACVHSGRKEFLIGVSCHSLEAAQNAADSGADYIFFGPIFATPSKATYGAPQGLERLAEVCGNVPIPVFAIGGISVDNAHSCIQAGAAGLAAIRLFQDAPDVKAIVAALKHR